MDMASRAANHAKSTFCAITREEKKIKGVGRGETKRMRTGDAL